jgi:hypothetical protein
MERLTNLDDVLDRVWHRLERAAEKPGHPFRTLTLGTAREDAPHVRTVIVRDTDRDARRLAFHTDRRTRKVEDIRDSDRIAWHGWTPDTREQLRLQGTATVHCDDEVADALWAAERPSSLDVYVRDDEPGTPVDRPRDGRAEAVRNKTLTRADVAEGRPYFAAVRTVIDEIEWLHLHPEGHYRARFAFDATEERFEGNWILP